MGGWQVVTDYGEVADGNAYRKLVFIFRVVLDRYIAVNLDGHGQRANIDDARGSESSLSDGFHA